jgi:alanyl-tRNA synthetase
LLRGVAERLNCAADDVVAAADRAISERDAHFKSAKLSLQRLAEADAKLTLQQQAPDAHGLRVVTRVFQEDVQPEYLGQLSTALAKANGTVALLARFPCGHLIFAQHPSAGKDMNATLNKVLEQFGGKGGGARDAARGKLNDAARGGEALDFAKSLLG